MPITYEHCFKNKSSFSVYLTLLVVSRFAIDKPPFAYNQPFRCMKATVALMARMREQNTKNTRNFDSVSCEYEECTYKATLMDMDTPMKKIIRREITIISMGYALKGIKDVMAPIMANNMPTAHMLKVIPINRLSSSFEYVSVLVRTLTTMPKQQVKHVMAALKKYMLIILRLRIVGDLFKQNQFKHRITSITIPTRKSIADITYMLAPSNPIRCLIQS